VAAIWNRTLERLRGEGLLIREDGRWKLTRRGFEVADHVAVELVL
jgi:uncharacterized protein (DUF2461 family)